MEKSLAKAIMNLQAKCIHQMIADLIKTGALDSVDNVRFQELFESISNAYSKINSLEADQ